VTLCTDERRRKRKEEAKGYWARRPHAEGRFWALAARPVAGKNRREASLLGWAPWKSKGRLGRFAPLALIQIKGFFFFFSKFQKHFSIFFYKSFSGLNKIFS
jgi:hypothetical protein